jgi:hypothetical protein
MSYYRVKFIPPDTKEGIVQSAHPLSDKQIKVALEEIGFRNVEIIPKPTDTEEILDKEFRDLSLPTVQSTRMMPAKNCLVAWVPNS